ncbi:hypothetical protein TUM20983_40560 [Mycobacterium antarcticum]|uniref:hypothetical protein n=1 Tax=unclassified Mycolicibacterium TaxID=2636767 RepID=UPI00238E4487|nr:MULTISPECIES: hypothetical protein [unclassified Mycolicibacterium]GLP76946.1 hypothetical protein TUM20983_40560 [Mycolicibacterium sp. TUM20983]GLP82633.1 hypothetical protein TUM20984_40530 [Mycolicibacterium sp. TUM20984]
MATAPPWTTAYLLKSRSSSTWVDVEIELGDENLRCVTREYSRWVDEELGFLDYEATLSLGEPVVVFDYRRDQIETRWLRQFYRGGFQVSQGNSRRWLITLVYPSGFGSLLDLMTDRAVWRSWRSALPATYV